MTVAAQPLLEPGRAYRTSDLRRWGANPTRLAERLVREGRLRKAMHGLFYTPLLSRFGAAPPGHEELLRVFLGGEPFLISGPPRWNALGLGATAQFATTLVYNTRRSTEIVLDGQRFTLRRVRFPDEPPEEYLVVDLIKHHGLVGLTLDELEKRLCVRLAESRWERARLVRMAREYGTKPVEALIVRAMSSTGAIS